MQITKPTKTEVMRELKDYSTDFRTKFTFISV